ncbi:permease-like cell division protein FtsX [Microgenomates group bacterium]|nr:permease-like cell division protein FtsX [Microgenomates group bacterium]
MRTNRTVWASIRRTPYQAFIAFAITTITMLLVYVLVNSLMMGHKILYYYEEQPKLMAFFKAEVGNEEAAEVTKQLMEHETFGAMVENVNFVDKETALEFYKENYQDETLLLELISAEIFPVTLEITPRDPQTLGVIGEMLSDIEQLDNIDFQADVVDTFLRWTNGMRNIGLGLCVVFGLITFFILNMIIGIKVISQRQGIKVMQIIGATRLYIRKPFIKEANIYALVSTLLAWGLVTGLLWLFREDVGGFFAPIAVLDWSPLWLGTQLMGGVVISWGLSTMAAWSAVSRILKKSQK